MTATDSISCAEILKRFPQFFVGSDGDLSRTITGVSAPSEAEAGTAVFLFTPKSISQATPGASAVWIVSPKQKDAISKLPGSRTLLFANQPERVMAAVVDAYFLKTPYTNAAIQAIHPTAVIASNASLGSGVRVGPHAFIGANVKIGDRVYIGANSIIEDHTQIGSDSVIHPLVYVGHSTLIGQRCEVHPNSTVGKDGFGYGQDEKWNHFRIPHQGRVVLEDDVHLGSCCTLDRGTFGETRIHAGAKLDNHIHVGHNTSLGRNSLVTAGFVIAGSTKVGDNFVSGGQSAVTGHIEVTNNVQLAAYSTIGKSITKSGAYGGNPLQPMQAFLKTKAAIVRLNQMRKDLARVMKHLGLNEEPAPSED